MKLYTKFLFLCSLFCLGACSWLDIEPEGEATSDKLFSTGDGIRSVLSGVYKGMTSGNLYGMQLQFGLVDCMSQQYTWNWEGGSNDSKSPYREAKAFNYTNTDLRKVIDAIWADGYNVIANANNLIQSMEGVSADAFEGGEAERNMILGEAYGCRALMHFDLCRLFAPAPVEKEGGPYLPYVDVYPTIQPVGIDVKPYLDKVVADLKKAKELTAQFDLSDLGKCVSSTYEARYGEYIQSDLQGYTAEIDDFYKGRGYRLSNFAITALLARVYMYMGDYENAQLCAEEVMNAEAKRLTGETFKLYKEDDWFSGIRTEKLEDRKHLKMPSTLVFALYNEEAYEDYNLESFFKKKVTDNTPGQWFVIDLKNQQYFNNSETGEDEQNKDPRGKYLLFTPEYERFSWGEPCFISAKGYSSEALNIRKDNVKILPVIRSTEMRYIIAECQARKNQFDEAYKTLNAIRSNKDLWDPLPQQNTIDLFLRDMVRDAQREFLSEGQLFYLYKRLAYPVQIGKEKRKMKKHEYMFPLPINQNM